MPLRNIFNRQDYIRTTAVPDGCSDWGDDLPEFLEARRNKFGSWDVAVHTKGTLFWHKEKAESFLPEQGAVNMLMDQELSNLERFYAAGPQTDASLRERIEKNTFSPHHIFSYMKKSPQAFDAWAAQREQPEEKPAPKGKPRLRLV